MTLSTEPAAVLAPKRRSRRVRLGHAIVVTLALIVALGCAGWYGRVPLLRGAAMLWIVSDPIGPADAVAVFGGGLEDRPFAAAAYYREGLVKKILVSNVREGPAERLGVLSPHTVLNRRILINLGVPEGDIETFGADLSNTHEEALALREWAVRAGAHSIIVPTEIFAARRLRWMLQRVLGDDTIVRVPAVDVPEYRSSDWWQDEQGLISFQNEVIKYLYYRVKY